MFACSELLYALNFFFMTTHNKYIPCLPGPKNHDMQDICFGNVSDRSEMFTSWESTVQMLFSSSSYLCFTRALLLDIRHVHVFRAVCHENFSPIPLIITYVLYNLHCYMEHLIFNMLILKNFYISNFLNAKKIMVNWQWINTIVSNNVDIRVNQLSNYMIMNVDKILLRICCYMTFQ